MMTSERSIFPDGLFVSFFFIFSFGEMSVKVFGSFLIWLFFFLFLKVKDFYSLCFGIMVVYQKSACFLEEKL